MRKKAWDRCQVALCPHPTASGEKESDLDKRYCVYCMPGGAKQLAFLRMVAGRIPRCLRQAKTICKAPDRTAKLGDLLQRVSRWVNPAEWELSEDGCGPYSSVCTTSRYTDISLRVACSEAYWSWRGAFRRVRCSAKKTKLPPLPRAEVPTDCTCEESLRSKNGKYIHLRGCPHAEPLGPRVPRIVGTCGVCHGVDRPTRNEERVEVWVDVFLAAHGETRQGGRACAKRGQGRPRDFHFVTCVCGSSAKLRLPHEAGDVRAQLRSFAKLHEGCREGDVPNDEHTKWLDAVNPARLEWSALFSLGVL